MPMMKKSSAHSKEVRRTASVPVTQEGYCRPDIRHRSVCSDEESRCPVSGINIAIETDEGDVQPPEIDVAETEKETDRTAPHKPDEDTPIRRHSISDRIQKLKLGEFLANSIKEEAEQRKKILENLLEEHEDLVKSINVAENRFSV